MADPSSTVPLATTAAPASPAPGTAPAGDAAVPAAAAAPAPGTNDNGPPSPAPAPLEPDEDEGNFTEGSSTADDRISSYTASLSSSVVDYPIEYGRRYHAFRPGSYKFPNDESEMDRLDLAHAMMVKAIGSRLYNAPLKKEKVQRILDIGTGTGLWAVEMGDVFENAEVLGIDLSPIQPEWVPPNVKFEIDDVESPWVGNRKYDFIMCRYMVASIKDWPGLIRNIFDHLNPGGWVEFQDVNTQFYSDDDTFSQDSATARWMAGFATACKGMGRDTDVAPTLASLLRQGGFPPETVHAHRIKAPLGPWAKDQFHKDLGMMNLILTIDGLEALSLKLFSELLGRTQEEILVETAAVRRELKTGAFGAFHAMFDIYNVYAQKPLETGDTTQ
ncbi:umta methyltransferase family protein [Colletotrichum scovillei]|uniref:Umta methyltransferase family protein n=2 Tax=Colletotrichum scovillei TaxID=1209932 RepID=A0A9P7ULH0_9PEZI|nr:umta methyltransferase family protein [Colletotrichum scovillei]KAG7074879.1 umta methyltransferase family protein [Colletotrichum scovillei]